MMCKRYNKSTVMLSIFAICFVLCSGWLFAATLYAQESPQVEVTVARANVRSGPSTSSAIIAKASRGDTFVINGMNAAQSWYQIVLNETATGWIAGSIVTVSGTLDTVSVVGAAADSSSDSGDTTSATAEGTTIQINRARVNLRGGPGTTYSIVGQASQGERFTVMGGNGAGNWYEIQQADGSTAWVFASLVLVQDNTQSIATTDGSTENQAPVASTATAVPASVETSEDTQPVVSTLPRGLASGRLLYSVANHDAKRWELWEFDFGTFSNTKIADWRTELDISNDGRQIAYFAWPSDGGEDVGIWIMDADFTNNRLLVPGGAYPSFNPGGDRLVVNGPERTMYLINSDGGGLRPLAKGEYPAWSPTDNRIVHRDCVGGSCGLWIIDANSNDPTARQHITTGASDGQPSWSPDGKRIAYISKEDGNFEIYVINSDGSNPVRLTSDPASDGLPVWSPDGRWIAFRSDRGGSWAIYIVRPDGSDLHKVIDADVLEYWFFEKMIWR